MFYMKICEAFGRSDACMVVEIAAPPAVASFHNDAKLAFINFIEQVSTS